MINSDVTKTILAADDSPLALTLLSRTLQEKAEKNKEKAEKSKAITENMSDELFIIFFFSN